MVARTQVVIMGMWGSEWSQEIFRDRMDKAGFWIGCVWGVRQRNPGDFQVSGHCSWVDTSNISERVNSEMNGLKGKSPLFPFPF